MLSHEVFGSRPIPPAPAFPEGANELAGTSAEREAVDRLTAVLAVIAAIPALVGDKLWLSVRLSGCVGTIVDMDIESVDRLTAGFAVIAASSVFVRAAP